jgi:hypothetical protein
MAEADAAWPIAGHAHALDSNLDDGQSLVPVPE